MSSGRKLRFDCIIDNPAIRPRREESNVDDGCSKERRWGGLASSLDGGDLSGSLSSAILCNNGGWSPSMNDAKLLSLSKADPLGVPCGLTIGDGAE
jgi:hypothetical protein